MVRLDKFLLTLPRWSNRGAAAWLRRQPRLRTIALLALVAWMAVALVGWLIYAMLT